MKRRSHRGVVAVSCVLVGALPLWGCSPTIATPSRQSADPSSPAAPAGRSPLDAVPSAAGPGASTETAPAHPPGHAHDHAGHDHGAAPGPAGSSKPAPAPSTPKNAAALYACPMHPEVRSNAPGLCPKCNMKLEKQP